MDASALKQLQAAAQHFAQGRIAEALQLCQAILRKFPTALDALHLSALIHRKGGNFNDAETLFRQCLSIAPERADVRSNFGNLLVARGLLGTAIDEYRQALQADPQFRPARLALARQLNATRQFDSALVEAQTLLDRNAQDAEAFVSKGVALRGLNQTAAAEEAYRAALRVKPNYAVAHHNLGGLLANASRSEEALAELDKAAALGVQGAELAFNRAAALMGLHEFDQAEAVLLETIHKTPTLEPLRLLARLRFMRGADNYVSEFEDAIAANPDNIALRLGLGQILTAAGELERAKDVLEDAQTRDPTYAPVHAELAAVHQESGDYGEALRYARLAEDANPEDAQPQDMIIDALLSLGNADEAMPIIERMRERYPQNQAYIAHEATAARLLGDARYPYYYNYELLVQPFDLSPPDGWADMASFQADLVTALNERHLFDAQPLDQSLRGGTQTPRGLLGDPDPVIQAFLGALREPIEAYRQLIGYDAKQPMLSRNRGPTQLTGCWSVRLKRGGFHINHVHPEGWLSSAYYVSVPEEVANTEEKSGWIKFGEPRFPVPGAHPAKFVQPKEGRLVLFPSYMWHGTMPIHGDEPRLTVAFDAIPAQDP